MTKIDKSKMTYVPGIGYVPKPGKQQPEKQTVTGPVPAEAMENPVTVTEEKNEPAGQKTTGENQKTKKKRGES